MTPAELDPPARAAPSSYMVCRRGVDFPQTRSERFGTGVALSQGRSERFGTGVALSQGRSERFGRGIDFPQTRSGRFGGGFSAAEPRSGGSGNPLSRLVASSIEGPPSQRGLRRRRSAHDRQVRSMELSSTRSGRGSQLPRACHGAEPELPPCPRTAVVTACRLGRSHETLLPMRTGDRSITGHPGPHRPSAQPSYRRTRQIGLAPAGRRDNGMRLNNRIVVRWARTATSVTDND
jgi:hypothetical protein